MFLKLLDTNIDLMCLFFHTLKPPAKTKLFSHSARNSRSIAFAALQLRSGRIHHRPSSCAYTDHHFSVQRVRVPREQEVL